MPRNLPLGSKVYNGVGSPWRKFRSREAVQIFDENLAVFTILVGGKGEQPLRSAGVPELEKFVGEVTFDVFGPTETTTVFQAEAQGLENSIVVIAGGHSEADFRIFLSSLRVSTFAEWQAWVGQLPSLTVLGR